MTSGPSGTRGLKAASESVRSYGIRLGSRHRLVAVAHAIASRIPAFDLPGRYARMARAFARKMKKQAVMKKQPAMRKGVSDFHH